jgi:hypothetical protein
MRLLYAALLLAGGARVCSAYSVLTHEAIIDTLWEDSFKPALRAKYPGLTDDQLREAHAYAYGGAIIQDMGYYPFGSKLFSDLVHYVRSGDFVVALLRDSQNANDYAFALGALAHYAADNNGHPIAINRAVPMLFPKLRRKFGNEVTYEDNPSAHLKTEFGFDVVEIAHGNYAPQAYHDFIGFQVSKPLLESAFQDTYGTPLKSMFKDLDLALGTYRHVVSQLIPEMTKVAWDQKKDEIGKSIPGITRRRFIYNQSRASYEKDWGRDYERPGPGAQILAFVLRFIPKVGPFRALGFRVPTPEAEKLLLESFNRTIAVDRGYVAEARRGDLQLPDRNLDTGRPLREGDYHLADKAFAELLVKLSEENSAVTPGLRSQVLAFYDQQKEALPEKAKLELQALRADPRATKN